jgi:hypothetical protein
MGEKEAFARVWLQQMIDSVRVASVLLKCSGATKANTEILASPE